MLIMVGLALGLWGDRKLEVRRWRRDSSSVVAADAMKPARREDKPNHALVRAGWIVRLGGMVGLSSGRLVDEAPQHLSLGWSLTVALAFDLLGVLIIAASFPMIRIGSQFSARIITSFDELIGQRYVLYLRSFAYDRAMAAAPPSPGGWWMVSPIEMMGFGVTVEDVLVRQFAEIGPVVAIGRPGERLPMIGARRGYLPTAYWQDAVSGLLRGSDVVMMMASLGHGTIWEFTEAVRTVAPTRLILLICGDDTEYQQFCAFVGTSHCARSSRSTPTGNHESPCSIRRSHTGVGPLRFVAACVTN